MPRSPDNARRLWSWTISVAVLYVILQIVEDQLAGGHLSTWIMGALLMAWSLYVGYRYHGLLIALIGLTAGLLAWHYEAAMHMDTILTPQSWTVHLIFFVTLLLFSFPAGLLQRKRTRSWHRWLLARAAEAASRGDAGYTSTPVTTRTAEYTLPELRRFAAFLEERRIAVAEWEEHALQLYLPGEWAQYQQAGIREDDCTCVRFHLDGRIAAHIMKVEYEEDFSAYDYPSLCTGLGNAVFDLLQRHRLGEVDLILRDVHDDTRQAVAVLVITGLSVSTFATLLYLQLL